MHILSFIVSPSHQILLFSSLLFSSLLFSVSDNNTPVSRTIPFDSLYDQNHFIKTLSDTTCIFSFDEKQDTLYGLQLPYIDEPVKSGSYYQRKVDVVRHMSGHIVSTELFGVFPETPIERAIQHKIFDAFKINRHYQKLADQYYNYVKKLALSRGGSYSAIQLWSELDYKGNLNANTIRYLVEHETSNETTVLYLAMGKINPRDLAFYKTALCDNRHWLCLEIEDIPIRTNLLFNVDTTFTVEVHLLTNAQSVVLDRGSMMSWVVMGERMKLGRDFQWGQLEGVYGPVMIRSW